MINSSIKNLILLSILDLVKFSPFKIPTLNSIRMYDVEKLMHKHSSAPLLWMRIIFVFCLHLFLWINWFKVLEIWTVLLNQFPKQLSLSLQNNVRKTVSINKEIFRWWMCMEVKIEQNSFCFIQPWSILFNWPDCGTNYDKSLTVLTTDNLCRLYLSSLHSSLHETSHDKLHLDLTLAQFLSRNSSLIGKIYSLFNSVKIAKPPILRKKMEITQDELLQTSK
jgi:hypothetical protein